MPRHRYVPMDLKKLLLLAVCLLVLTGQVTAQQVAGAKKRNYEDQVRPMSVALALGIARGFAADLKKMNDLMESDDTIKLIVREVPSLGKDLPSTAFLEKLPIDKRIEAIDNAASHYRDLLKASDRWQFDAGTTFVNSITPIMTATKQGEGVDVTKLDETVIKQNLRRLAELTSKPPPDFPKEVLEKLTLFAAFSTKEHLLTVANLNSLVTAMMDVAETISPD